MKLVGGGSVINGATGLVSTTSVADVLSNKTVNRTWNKPFILCSACKTAIQNLLGAKQPKFSKKNLSA